jgi:hypothetical protein
MADNKKSFVAYVDWKNSFDMLTDTEAGQLVKHLLAYVNDENPELDDRYLKLAFEPIKLQLKRDLQKYEIVKGRRSEAGKKGGLKSGETRKQIEANEANASSVKQNEANEAGNDNVTVNVNDTVNGNVTGTDILLKKETKDIEERKLKFASTLEQYVAIYSRPMVLDFYKYWTEPNKSNTKFKQELEKTWALERRLETWAKNDKNFSNGKSSINTPATDVELKQSANNAVDAMFGYRESG